MVFEKLSIDCESIENRNEVFKVLNSIGYTGIGDHDDFLFVHTYKDGDYQTYYEHDNVKQLTYKQFMEKYSNKESVMNKQLMISIIDAAKKQLNLGNSELSLKLGHHRNYISRVLHQENPTPEQMTKVVDKVNALIAEQKELLPEFNPIIISDAVMVSKDEYDNLKKELDHKNQVLDKRNAVLENHINRVNELELQLKTTQQKFVDVVDQKDSEIKKLQKDCNHATNQYHGKCDEVARLKKKIKNQTTIYLIIIVIISLIGIMGFAS
ncbi:MAG: hypothetical protein RSE18_07065 [Acinetobacter sp.]